MEKAVRGAFRPNRSSAFFAGYPRCKTQGENSRTFVLANNGRDRRPTGLSTLVPQLRRAQNATHLQYAELLLWGRVHRASSLRPHWVGRQVVDEMGRLGIIVDLSHVGSSVTSEDVIEYATKPPCFNHVLPGGLLDHPRNKPNHLLQLIGEKGGSVGISQFGPHMVKGNESTIDDCVAAVDFVIDLIGEI